MFRDCLIGSSPSAEGSVAEGEVHVWSAALDGDNVRRGRMIGILSDAERDRANRYRFEIDRRRFIVRRAVLRMILGRYLTQSPRDLEFDYDKFGKPELSDPAENPNIAFNLSHSDGLALYAITRNLRVGIDVECLRPIAEFRQIAANFFSRPESAHLFSLPPARQLKTFFRYWTCKEAYLKACGKGLSEPLNEVEFRLDSSGSFRLANIASAPKAVSRWSVNELDLCSGYVGALVVEGKDLKIAQWVFPF